MEVFAVYAGSCEESKMRELCTTKEIANKVCRKFELNGWENCFVESVKVKDVFNEEMPDRIYFSGYLDLGKTGEINFVQVNVWDTEYGIEDFPKTFSEVSYQESTDKLHRRYNFDVYGYFRKQVNFKAVLKIEDKEISLLRKECENLVREQFKTYNEKFLEEESEV